MMKTNILVLLVFLLVGCNNSYEKEELKAIEDLANDYLKRNHLPKVLNPESYPFPGEKPAGKPNIDTLDLKVYLSDALMPISQVKEDNEWMFNDNYFGTPDSAIFYGIVNSNRFKELKYREFIKHSVKFNKPYRLFEKSQEKIRTEEEYTILQFSRVCFDEKKENGVVVIDYKIGFESGSMNGYHMALLIKKKNNKWIYIKRK